MKVIGHRGAAGLALENTVASFEIATLLGVDAIELDVHRSVDENLVVIHDPDLRRVSQDDEFITIKNSLLRQIQAVKLEGGSRVPTLKEVLSITKPIDLIIELKASGCTNQILEIVKHYPDRNFTIASFKHAELSKLRKHNVRAKLYALERTKPLDIIHTARHRKLDGIGLNYWLLNPLNYWLCKRYGLEIYVYTVNSRLIGKMIRYLYPRVMICTDHPERFVKTKYPLPNLQKRSK